MYKYFFSLTRRLVCAHSRKFRKDEKFKKIQIKLLERKTKMKNILDGIKVRLDIGGKKIRTLKNIAIETI